MLSRPYAANLAGVAWTAGVQLVCTPLYLRILGIESYGLIGFALTLQAILLVFDLGVSPTVNREIARRSTNRLHLPDLRDLVRTFEAAYWVAAIAMAAALVGSSGYIASEWLSQSRLSIPEIGRAAAWMGVLCSLQWLVSFYQAALIGLEEHVVLNVMKIASATSAHLGGVFLLLYYARSLSTLFAWQALIAMAHVTIIAIAVWRKMPEKTHKARVRPAAAFGAWRFAAGMTGITLCAVLLAQMDKVVVSRLLPLSSFGYYSLASVVASALFVFVIPMFNTVFPRFSALVATADEGSVRSAYHRATQVLAVLILPAATVIGFFGPQILYIWTGDLAVARESGNLARLLVIGTAINGLMNIPYGLQLAYGETRLAFSLTVMQLAIVIAALLIFVPRYGTIGAALAWPTTNLCYLLVGIPLTHRRVLRGEGTKWMSDAARPLIGSLIVAAAAFTFLPTMQSRAGAAAVIAMVYVFSLLAAILAADGVRAMILARVTAVTGGRKQIH